MFFKVSDVLTLVSKVRLWCLQIPLPKIAPIIVAALPIPNTLDSKVLEGYSDKIIRGLIARSVKVVSYACDGTEVERSVQHRLNENAADHRTYTVPSPCKLEHYELSTHVALIDGQPVVMVQDSKHALKTFRNNLFSGARALPMGDYLPTYRRIREVAFAEGSPLYHRDVEKLDRQDDNAATRLFSAATLNFLVQNYKEDLGEIVYLFVFGELVDAYQNRHISHSERMKMLLRASYFMQMWQTLLKKCGYAITRYCLSREALDITHLVIKGLFALIMVHRDYSATNPFPLLPWLHGSEGCEHVFGESRGITKDFTMLDFYYMIRKLDVKLREAAAGYNHTYMGAAQVDLLALTTYPSDAKITIIAQQAFEEAESLIALLGIVPSLLYDENSSVRLPSLPSWFPDTEADDTDDLPMLESDANELHQLLCDRERNMETGRLTKRQKDALEHLTFAAVSLSIDDAMKIHDLPVIDDATYDDYLSQDSANIHNALITSTITIAPIEAEDEPEKPLGKGILRTGDLDLSTLVHIRTQHQTLQAAKGVRTRVAQTSQSADGSIRQHLMRQFHEVLRVQQDQALGTGRERQARWCESESTGGAQDKRTGNALNAAQTAAATAKQALKQREKVFQAARVPSRYLRVLHEAGIGPFSPLQVGDYGIVHAEFGLAVGRVTALYNKSGGKYGKHSSIESSTIITGVSYIVVQVFEIMFGRKFRAITKATAMFQVKQFAHLPSTMFLCKLETQPEVSGQTISISSADSATFNALFQSYTTLVDAAKLFRKRQKAPELEPED
ncbi:hypothetical protein OBBRIDRAFT_863358 [Obba rivulosa]|uniref:Uncharacterized protein n=1 Tax=Obba rivulosa TaxID=1052685 RepID=A0A8E2B2T0_9APHY|nr:hypothetical protein OBBRIDRAFT_863358 [Obba rivulosa]